MDFKLDEINVLLSGAMIAAPKSVIANENVYLESKILFSELFTNAVSQIEVRSRTAETVSQIMKKNVKEMSVPEIQYYCCCSEKKADYVRGEVIRLINHTNISECLKERA